MKSDMKYDEVAQHASETDCWIVIDGKVCNVTDYLNQHPGGAELLLAFAGKDATEEFTDIGHTPSAIQIRDSMVVGTIDKNELSKYQIQTPNTISINTATLTNPIRLLFVLLVAVFAARWYV